MNKKEKEERAMFVKASFELYDELNNIVLSKLSGGAFPVIGATSMLLRQALHAYCASHDYADYAVSACVDVANTISVELMDEAIKHNGK